MYIVETRYFTILGLFPGTLILFLVFFQTLDARLLTPYYLAVL